jgi:uncharacterized membrane protein YeaQ/YmgE (transglycosylase-associated protein family)
MDLLGWNVGMSLLAAVLLVAISLVIGGLASMVGDVRIRGEWALTAVGALIGGWVGSEALAGASTWGPEFEGWFVLPSIIGAVIVGTVVDAITRYATEGSYALHPRPV